jgi:Leucine-rich repeat (LRR) protein
MISKIEPFSFACFNILPILDLSNQMLSDLPSFEIFFGLKSLINLRLNNNSLTRIRNQTFIRLEKLSSLDLSSNKLNFIDIDAFVRLENLTELFLVDNMLKTLKASFFKSTKKLSIVKICRNKLTSIGFSTSFNNLDLGSNRLQFLKNNFLKI